MPAHWHELTLPDGRELTTGQHFRVTGERGTFKFSYADSNGDVTCYGGLSGRGMVRTFKAERVTKFVKPPRNI